MKKLKFFIFQLNMSVLLRQTLFSGINLNTMSGFLFPPAGILCWRKKQIEKDWEVIWHWNKKWDLFSIEESWMFMGEGQDEGGEGFWRVRDFKMCCWEPESLQINDWYFLISTYYSLLYNLMTYFITLCIITFCNNYSIPFFFLFFSSTFFPPFLTFPLSLSLAFFFFFNFSYFLFFLHFL